MPGRLEDRICIVVGGGQMPGQTLGNGQATALDVLHNNVGTSSEGGDSAIGDITVEVFDRIHAVNHAGQGDDVQARAAGGAVLADLASEAHD